MSVSSNQPLTDEELAEWEATARWLCEEDYRIRRLIADLRASRAEVALLRAECEHLLSDTALLEAQAEVERLTQEVGELQGILIDNIHDVRTALHGSSSAMACTPKEAHERTVAEVERLRATSDELTQALRLAEAEADEVIAELKAEVESLKFENAQLQKWVPRGW